MKKTEMLHLIEGVFTQADAEDLLLGLFDYKINFHKLKDWSSNERFGKDDELAHRSIPELKKEVQKLVAILDEAKKLKKNIVISSQINIVLVDK